MKTLLMVVQILGFVAELYPKLAPAVKDLMSAIKAMIRGEPIQDITQEEFEARIDAAIAKLPVWE